MLTGQADVLTAILGPEIGRVNDGQQAVLQSLASNVIEEFERVTGRCLIVLIVGDETSAVVRRQHLGLFEVLARERRLAGARHSDKYDQRKLRDFYGVCRHRLIALLRPPRARRWSSL